MVVSHWTGNEREVSNTKVKDLFSVLVDSQSIEIHNPNDENRMYGRWSGKAKDIPCCYFDSNIIKMYSIFYKCNTEFSFIVVFIDN